MTVRLGLVSITLLLFSLLAPRTAHAQKYLLGGNAQIAAGVDGSGDGFRPARLRLRIGGDMRIDESPDDIFAAALLADVTVRAAVGADLRYMRLVGKHFAVSGGAVGYVFPFTLVGPSAGLDYRIPLSKTSWLTIGPELNFFVFGSDLPENHVLFQGLLQGGIHADL